MCVNFKTNIMSAQEFLKEYSLRIIGFVLVVVVFYFATRIAIKKLNKKKTPSPP